MKYFCRMGHGKPRGRQAIFARMTNRYHGKFQILRFTVFLLAAGICCPLARAADSSSPGQFSNERSVDTFLENMTLEEKIAQMFFLTPDTLTNTYGAEIAGEVTKTCFDACPVGGLVYLEQNLISREQVTDMMGDMQDISMSRLGIPIFLAVDEEGGIVRRLSGRGIEGVPLIGSMQEIGETGDPEKAYQIGREIGSYLSAMNLNVDFAPVADIFSNPENTVIGSRAFGSDPQLVSCMVSMEVNGLKDSGVLATLKHFPGHGNTSEDSHAGYACSHKTLEELRKSELRPFKSGIEAGADFVMMGHISLPDILGDDTPASLSHTIITDVLRKELGFDGIVITDALNMGAIVNNYSSAEAAILAVQAGADMLLMPGDFQSAYQGVLDAVQNGRIPEERIDESVERIIKAKLMLEKK